MTTHRILSRWTGAVLYEGEAETLRDLVATAVAGGADLRDAYLRGAYLRDADLRGANLGGAYLRDADTRRFRSDLWDVLLRAPAEIPALRAALVAGRVDGSVYQGECACLVGTIANARHCAYDALGNGITPDSSRPAEQWFMAIRRGDTPESSPVVALTVTWVDEFVALLDAACVARAGGV